MPEKTGPVDAVIDAARRAVPDGYDGDWDSVVSLLVASTVISMSRHHHIPIDLSMAEAAAEASVRAIFDSFEKSLENRKA